MTSFRFFRVVTWAVLAAMMIAMVPALPGVEAAGGVIAYGEQVSGQITNKNYYEAWEFTGDAGDRVQILMEGDGKLDPYLGLIDAATETVLAEDDDSGGESNAYIELTLESSGNFIIVATRYNLDIGTSSGGYDLSLVSTSAGSQTPISNTNSSGSNAASTTEPVEVDPGVFYMGDVALAEPVGNSISGDSYAHLYSVELTRGTELVIAMLADGSKLDSYLIFANEDGDVLAEDDDSGAQVGAGNLDALLQLKVPEDGMYYIIASRSGLDSGKSTGDYALIAAEPEDDGPVQNDTSDEEEDLPPGMAAFGMIEIDQEANEAITDDAYFHIYGFEGQAGDEITITMRGEGDLDAYLGLLDPSDNVVAEDDDSGGDYDAQITLRLAESGVYIIVATRSGIDDGTTTGDYSLIVSSGPPPAETTGITGFAGLPGRALTNEAGRTLFLSGNGRSSDPAKNTPIEMFAGSDLPGRGTGLNIPRPNQISLNFEEIKFH